MPTDYNTYVKRRAEITREQNKLIRDMLDGRMDAHKNWIVVAVRAENYEEAHRLADALAAHQDLCKVFPPDDMWAD